jgi:hypothetical protein
MAVKVPNDPLTPIMQDVKHFFEIELFEIVVLNRKSIANN